MTVKLVECPRDAMQGIKSFIPTEVKINYLNALLQVGFDTLDFGSFVSPKAIPQLADTAEVLEGLQIDKTATRLLAIVANMRGAEDAITHAAIRYIGFPFSVSETFQMRNTNQTMIQAFDNVKQMQSLCEKSGKDLVVYLSMGFGNPYGDAWNTDVVEYWVEQMQRVGIRTLALSDTIGVANPESITYLFSSLIPHFPEIEFGAHLHTTPDSWRPKVDAAYKSGCRRFDGALKGFGGCPMAADTLTGNMPTENMITYFSELHEPKLNLPAIHSAMLLADEIFNTYH
ncbi:MAG: hydroxymethylglutaryl-CoA lyase [Bacteroidota bacterium]|jgi:hydroxymethylglutaryl-CoA lyase